MNSAELLQCSILVVDDQPINLQILRPILSKRGYRIIEATTGRSALARIAQENIDLILLDIMLPDIDGYAICRQIKADPHTTNIPVIFISALGDVRNKLEGFQAGGVDYISKPFDVDEVLARVDAHIMLNKMRQELQQKNEQLYQEITERIKAQSELHAIKDRLEEHVARRTAELQLANEQLSTEIAMRQAVEHQLRRSQERLALAIAETGGILWDCQLDPNLGYDDQPNLDRLWLRPSNLLEDQLESEPSAFWENPVLAEDLPEKNELERAHFYGLTDYLEYDYRVRQPNGEIRFMHSRSRIIRDNKDRPIRWVGIDWDVTGNKNVEQELSQYRNQLEELVNARTADLIATNERLLAEMAEREKAQNALRESQSNYFLLFNSMLDGYAMHEIICDDAGVPIDYRFLDINPAFERHTGMSRDIVGRTVREVIPQIEPYWIETYGQVALTGQPVQFENYAHAVDDKWFEVIAISPQKNQFATIFHDITERKRADKAIRESQTELKRRNSELVKLNAEYIRLDKAIEQAAESIIITDTSGGIIYVNPAFEQVTGYSRADVLGKNPRIFKSGKHNLEFYQNLWQTITNGHVWHGRLINRNKGGSLFTEDATISPVRDETGVITHFVAVKRDITHELQLEEQYHQAQKMEALGRLTGGVAHDFNNLLTAINGFAELIKLQLGPEDPRQPMLNNILHSGQRASDLVRQLLAFSRKQIIEPQMLNLNSVVHHMQKMLQRIIGEDIQLETKLAADLWPILFDPAQLEQIIVNLAVNARDAMPDGGRLSIETANIELTQTQLDPMPDLQPGKHVVLTISDTGIGMPEEILPHIFEPFFTTKEIGKGTGLGLATVYGIIKQNSGEIQVQSAVGQGSQFGIYLPRVEVALPEPARLKPDNRLPTGTETILIAEDDIGVRELTSHILGGLGYRLLKAGNGEEALNAARTYPDQIHLLLADVVMPDIVGPKLAAQLLELRPSIKTVFMSGYTDSTIARHGLTTGSVTLLHKPFSAVMLAKTIRQALDT
ncbi:MAG: Sensor histidine kinase RcsC [Anaerolineae bacterium]|nr:Sensor histidine kinase RcsC [Anaerolineae bacterium]